MSSAYTLNDIRLLSYLRTQEAEPPRVKSKKRKSHSGDSGANGDNERKSGGRIEHLNYKVRICQIGV